MTIPKSQIILVFVSRSADASAVAAALPAGVESLVARNAAQALEHVRTREVALVIVALSVGVVAADALRQAASPKVLPLLFVSGEPIDEAESRGVYALEAAELVSLRSSADVVAAKIKLMLAVGLATADTSVARGARDEDAPPERYQLLAEAASDYALFFLDAKGVVVEWTVSAEQLFGFLTDEAVGRKGAIIFTPEDRARGAPEAEMEEAARTGQAKDNRIHVRKDGSTFPTNGRMVALRRADGRLRGFAKIVRDATALQQLEESERKFRQIFETAHEGIWILDARARIEMVNQRLAEMLGYDVTEMIGREKFAFVFPEDESHLRALFEQRRAGQAATTEVRFRRKNGESLWTLMSARPRQRQGEFIGALDMFSDISARRLAEERFRVFFESSAAGNALVEPATGRFLHVNRRWCEMLGRTEAELLQLAIRDVTHPEDRVKDIARYADLASGRVAEITAEKRYLRGDGSFFWGQVTASVVRDTTGMPLLQLGIVHDITARKRAEEELLESRTRLRLAIETAELGVFYHDQGNGASEWSARARQLLGVGEEPVTAERLLGRVFPDDRERVHGEIEAIRQSTAEAREFSLEFRVGLPGGRQRFIAVHGVSQKRPSLAAGGSLHIVATLRDVTAVKEAELDLRNKVAERTRELEEKTRQLEGFVYTVAHDLRAPLRSINGVAEILSEELGTMPPDEALGNLERIKASTRRMDTLIRDLVAYSRVSQVDLALEIVDLRAVVHAALREVQGDIARSGAEIVVRDALPLVWGERGVVEQVVVNLVSNAIKFTRPGERPEVEIAARRRAEWVRVEVRDRGIGIAAEYHAKIFQVFERLQSSRQYPGTGIGLAIVAKGVERLGGRWGVESAPGEGSTFWVELKPAES